MRNGYTNTHVRARREKTECCFKTADTDTKLDALQGKKTVTLKSYLFYQTDPLQVTSLL